MKMLLSRVFVLTGILLIVWGGILLYQRYSPSRLAFSTEPNMLTHSINHIDSPKKLLIETRNMDLQIFPAEILAKKWQISNQGVSYLTNTVLPGERGNSVIYGHNWSSILGNLSKVKPGDVIKIDFESGKQKEFVVEYVFEVMPSQVDILNQTEDARLTIYTCSGFLDSKRLVVVAKPTQSISSL